MEDLHYSRRLEGLISHAVDIVQNMPVLGNEVPECLRRQTEILLKVDAVLPGTRTLDKIPDELLPAEKTFETCIMGIGYLKSHRQSVGQGGGVSKDSSQAEY